MARKTKAVVIEAEGRDRGKHYLLTEMAASQAEKWAVRVFLALAKAGVEVDDDTRAGGMAALAAPGIAAVTPSSQESVDAHPDDKPTFARRGIQVLGRLNFADAEPLLDEMMGCVQAVPDPARPQVIRPLLESDIEEVATRALLRMEVLQLHVGFSLADIRSKLRMPATEASASG